jgi:DNA-binding transcriptional ArsR family regulator
LKLYKTLESPALVQALAHPLRAKMLYVLQEQEASPKELAVLFGLPLSNVAYHIQVLRRLKLIRLVRKTPRRGAVEHHYKADYAANVDDAAWSGTPGVIKERMVAAVLEEIGEYVTRAAATGGFNRENAWLSRSRLVLDEEAWDVLAVKLAELHEMVENLQKQSAKRLKRSDHAGERRAGLVMMLFDSLPSIPEAGEAGRSGSPTASDVRPPGTLTAR